MELNEIISLFCTEFGVDGVQPDEGGAYALAIDGIEVAFAECDGVLVMAADIGKLPAECRERLYRLMLTAMHGAEGTMFSVDDERDTAVLHRRDELSSLTFEAFKARLEKFVNLLEDWRKIFMGFVPLATAMDKEEARRSDENSSARLGVDGFVKV